MERFNGRILIRDDNYTTKDPLLMGGGFSWPPRSYNCSFCRRDFKSAQALGGHMNVHRRDRARLRQSPPWDPPIPSNPNPNPNPSSPSSTRSNYPLPNLNFPPPPSAISETTVLSPQAAYASISPGPSRPMCDVSKSSTREVKALSEVKKMKGLELMGEEEGDEDEEKDVVGLDLEIGADGEGEKELDLELRLGYAWV